MIPDDVTCKRLVFKLSTIIEQSARTDDHGTYDRTTRAYDTYTTTTTRRAYYDRNDSLVIFFFS